MTFTQIKAAIKDYCLLTSTEADTRVGTAINRHYRRITSQLGMDATRFVTRTQTTSVGGQTVTFTAIEKIDRVLDTTDLVTRRLLAQVSLHALRAVQPGTGPPTEWALQNTDAAAVTILLDTQPAEPRSLQADGWTTLADLSGDDEPVFPESFHDVLVWFVISEELLKKEKLQLAGTYEAKADKLLAELRFHLADSPLRETRQADPRISALAGGGGSAGGGGGTGGGLTEHHPTHEAGGSDELSVTALGGFPGGTSTFLRADQTFAPTGDVVGPATSVDDRIATFEGVTGKVLQDGGQTIAQVIAAATPPGITSNGTRVTGIAFPATQVPSADPNTLDDYEEGTWTPYIGGTGGVSGQTYSAQTGRYVKIGRFVEASFTVSLTNKGTISAFVILTALPFTAAGLDVAFCNWANLATSWVNVHVRTNAETTYAYVLGGLVATIGNDAALTTADITNTTALVGTLHYQVPV